MQARLNAASAEVVKVHELEQALAERQRHIGELQHQVAALEDKLHQSTELALAAEVGFAVGPRPRGLAKW